MNRSVNYIVIGGHHLSNEMENHYLGNTLTTVEYIIKQVHIYHLTPIPSQHMYIFLFCQPPCVLFPHPFPPSSKDACFTDIREGIIRLVTMLHVTTQYSCRYHNPTMFGLQSTYWPICFNCTQLTISFLLSYHWS